MRNNAFSRAQEEQADKFGLELVQKVYGHTFGSEEFFAHLLSEKSALHGKLVAFLSTHPATEDRLIQVQKTQLGKAPKLVQPLKPFAEWGCI